MCFSVRDVRFLGREIVEEFLHDLFFTHDFFAGEDVFGSFEELLESEFFCVGKVFYRNYFFLEVASDEVSFDEVVFCWSWSSDEYAFEVFVFEELVRHVLGDFFDVFFRCFFSESFESLAALSSCAEFSRDLRVCFEEGNDCFSFEEREDSVSSVHDHHTVDFFDVEHIL